MGTLVDITGQKFGRLTVLSRVGTRGTQPTWLCDCECGNTKEIRGDALKSGRTRSCGCFQKEELSNRQTVHGLEYGSEEHKLHVRNLNMQHKYGITLDDFNKLVEEQGGVCAICETSLDDLEHTAHLDHCHETGKVRGVLCKKCNTGLGMFDDDISRITQAAAYLNRRA